MTLNPTIGLTSTILRGANNAVELTCRGSLPVIAAVLELF